MNQLTNGKVWALWALLTITYTLMVLINCEAQDPGPWLGVNILLRCALLNFFLISFLFDHTVKSSETKEN